MHGLSFPILLQVQRKLIIALVLALLFMIVEVVGGVLANR
jgi:Co/Zn/Cd efflux system component